MHAYRDLSERMYLDRVKRETNHLYRGPPRKVELFNARRLVHAYDVDLVSVCPSIRTSPTRAYRDSREPTPTYPNPAAKCT